MKYLPIACVVAAIGCGRAPDPPPVLAPLPPDVPTVVAPDEDVRPMVPAADTAASAASAASPAGAVSPASGTATVAVATCEAGDAEACFLAGWRLFHGEGVAVDEGRGRALFERACEADVAKACGHLGLLYEFGKSVPVDRASAFRYFRRGCSLGEVRVSCFNAGRLQLESDDLSPRERSEAVGWLRSACDAEVALACCDLGFELERRGSGPDATREAAARWYRRACELGVREGCAHARAPERDDRGGGPDLRAPGGAPGADAGP